MARLKSTEFMSQFMVSTLSIGRKISTKQSTGSAPDISGKSLVNPVAMLLSVSMMLKYSLCEPELAAAVDQAVKQSIEKGVTTKDIHGSSSTSEVGDAIAAELAQILKASS